MKRPSAAGEVLWRRRMRAARQWCEGASVAELATQYRVANATMIEVLRAVLPEAVRRVIVGRRRARAAHAGGRATARSPHRWGRRRAGGRGDSGQFAPAQVAGGAGGGG